MLKPIALLFVLLGFVLGISSCKNSVTDPNTQPSIDTTGSGLMDPSVRYLMQRTEWDSVHSQQELRTLYLLDSTSFKAKGSSITVSLGPTGNDTTYLYTDAGDTVHILYHGVDYRFDGGPQHGREYTKYNYFGRNRNGDSLSAIVFTVMDAGTANLTISNKDVTCYYFTATLNGSLSKDAFAPWNETLEFWVEKEHGLVLQTHYIAQDLKFVGNIVFKAIDDKVLQIMH